MYNRQKRKHNKTSSIYSFAKKNWIIIQDKARHITPTKFTRSRDGAVVRALASHKCVPGSIPGPGVICGLSLSLVLVLAPRVFFGFSGFPPSSKINISKFQFDRELEGHGFVSLIRLLCVTLVKQCRFIQFLQLVYR